MINPGANLIDRRFGKLVVLERIKRRWKCVCDCGKTRLFKPSDLTLGNNSSCGCLSKHKIARQRHGLHDRPEYIIWVAMIKRCENPKNSDFKYYGGRGVKVCDRWRASFAAFLNDVGERPAGLWLDRTNNLKGYEPGNVEWKTPTEQQRNKRNNHLIEVRGKLMTVREAHEKYGRKGVEFYAVKSRIQHGWDAESALSKPIRTNA